MCEPLLVSLVYYFVPRACSARMTPPARLTAAEKHLQVHETCPVRQLEVKETQPYEAPGLVTATYHPLQEQHALIAVPVV